MLLLHPAQTIPYEGPTIVAVSRNSQAGSHHQHQRQHRLLAGVHHPACLLASSEAISPARQREGSRPGRSLRGITGPERLTACLPAEMLITDLRAGTRSLSALPSGRAPRGHQLESPIGPRLLMLMVGVERDVEADSPRWCVPSGWSRSPLEPQGPPEPQTRKGRVELSMQAGAGSDRRDTKDWKDWKASESKDGPGQRTQDRQRRAAARRCGL